MPFGINLAPKLFQLVNEKIFDDIEGVIIYFDDLLVATETEAEHDEVLKKVVERTKECKIKFNSSKLQYKQKSVKYLEQVFNEEGVAIDEDKIDAIKNLKSPTNKKELQSILGMIGYLRNFISNLSELTTPLRLLLKKGTHFMWLAEHDIILNEIKKVITTAPVLGTFDINKDIKIQCDASQNGLGCCLIQDGKPIAYASRAMSSTEKNYAQIEKELLAVVFAIRKFHQYVYGKEVEIITDHKPLLAVMNKHVANINSCRLQRLKFKLIPYSITMKFCPGKKMFVADLLSRNFIDTQHRHDVTNDEMVHMVRMTENRKKEYIKYTEDDQNLQTVKGYVVNGWPDKEQIPRQLKHFYNERWNLHFCGGLMFLNNKVVVAERLRKKILKK